MDIQPGSKVKITVKSTLKTDRAKKTLARVFMKDLEIRKTRNTNPKPVTSTMRAGRFWNHRPSGTVNRVPSVGDTAQVVATVDVIHDLQSVEKYIAVL